MSIESPGNQRMGGRAEPLISTFAQDADALGSDILSVAVIGPEQQGRKAVAKAVFGFHAGTVREFSSYPELDDLPKILNSAFDVIIVELDTNPEHALDLVEHICGQASATVMVYSAHTDSELLVRCMRAGAREFLTQPIAPSTIAEAMVRASVRRPAHRPAKQAEGKASDLPRRQRRLRSEHPGRQLCGCACAGLAQARRPARSQSSPRKHRDRPRIDCTALRPGCLEESGTSGFALSLHRHGQTQLRAVGAGGSGSLLRRLHISDDAIEKLVNVVRQDFDYVVVDAGAGMGLAGRALLSSATTVYLVLQVSLPELRNANRIISEFFQSDTPQLEIVLNRFTPRSVEIDEEAITKALTMPAKWRVPSDYAAVRKAQNTATPLVLEGSPISQAIRQMARSAPGCSPAVEAKKKKFSIFG